MSTDAGAQLARSQDIAQKVALVYGKRAKLAHDAFVAHLKEANAKHGVAALLTDPSAAARLWTDWYAYALDASQRSVLYWDTIRRRGNAFVEHTLAGLPPVLHFDFETVLDGRTLPRPVNYALVRIVPPAGVTIDPKLRPYIIIDPRAGTGRASGASRTTRRSASRFAAATRSTS
jgi:hypothetical protein